MSMRRRDFMKTAGAVSVAPLAAPVVPLQAFTAGRPEQFTDEITRQTLKEAEKLTGVRYTDAQRDQILRTIRAQIEHAGQLRALGLKNDDPPPALVFDPRLPQSRVPEAKWRLQRRQDVPPLPSSESEIAFAPLTSLSEWIRSGQLSSRRLTEIYLRRIDRYADSLDCIITVTRKTALEQAERADREISAGRYRGPLHGIPYGAKDLLDTAGIRTTWGAMPYKDRIADKDAAVIEKLNEAGAVLLAKTALGALAFGYLWYDGLTRNPWNPEEGSGGSSAGSASAVAAGLMGFALGSETLGSIENPSARTGVAGLRPTFGRVSRYGAMILCWSLDKIGPMCRNAVDTLLVLKVLNGHDPRDPGSIAAPLNYDSTARIRGMRVGYMPEWFARENVPEEVRSIPGIIADLGMEPVHIRLPDLPYQSLLSILRAEAAAAHEQITLSGRDQLLRGQTPLSWPNIMRQARFIPAVDYLQANRLRRKVMHILHDLFSEVDAVMAPSIPVRGGSTVMTLLTNYTGHPALTLKTGFTRTAARRSDVIAPEFYGEPSSGILKKVPACVSLWGPLFEEGRLCRIASALERQTGISDIHPQLLQEGKIEEKNRKQTLKID